MSDQLATEAGGDLARAAAAHVRHIMGPTIMMGDGSYFDFLDPVATTMTIEDYAYGLAYTARFRGQTRMRHHGNIRTFYSVAEHCLRGADQLLQDGFGRGNALAFLMHESGEVVWGDLPGPAKEVVPAYRDLEHAAGAAINAYFRVVCPDPALIKRYDLRMLATEKRDLMPRAAGDRWDDLRGFQPFDFEIRPLSPDAAARRFLAVYAELSV